MLYNAALILVLCLRKAENVPKPFHFRSLVIVENVHPGMLYIANGWIESCVGVYIDIKVH